MKKVFFLFTYIFVFPIIPSLSFLIMFLFWDNYTGIFVVGTLVCCSCLIFNYVYFARKTNQLHKMDNDYFKLSINQLKKENGRIEARLQEGKWVIEIQEQRLEFALDDYPFQKSYICAYFIRQITYCEMNELHKPLRYLFQYFYKPLKVLKKKELCEVSVDFYENDKLDRRYVVKNYKPLNGWLKNGITQAPYYWLAFQRHSSGNTLNKIIKRIDEVAYWDNGSEKVRAERYKNM